jgi:Ca2+-binding RTX toxin-like protein
VSQSLAAGRGTAGEALGDTLVQINDLVGSAFKDSLHGDNGENWLYGGSGDDALYGNGGDDVLNGGTGADVLYGGTGWNAASYLGASAGVAVDLATGHGTAGEALGDTLVQISDLLGSGFNDSLSGNAGSNGLYGGAGNDTLVGNGGADLLVGGSGADFFDGGDGFDMASYAASSAGVYINLVAGRGYYGDAQGDTLVNISDLVGTNFSDSLSGDAGDNWLYGGGGNDKLVGNGGNDVLIGGAGADVLSGGAGINAASYEASSAGVWIDLTNGKGLYGDAQKDTLIQISDLIGSHFNDQIYGTGGSNFLYGGDGADRLYGNGGNDVLQGGAGADMLTGGAGADLFLYQSATEIGSNASNRDGITDFNRAQGDRIDLSDIDANTVGAGNQAFTFIGAAGFTGQAGQLRAFYEGHMVVEGDLNGDRVADISLVVGGPVTFLVASDFAL